MTELTPVKTPLKRQASLSKCWPGLSDASSPATPSSHKKIKAFMTPEASARFAQWAGENLSHEKGETDIDESKWATNCINTWCWHMKELKAMQKSNAKYSYEKNHNVAEHDHEAYKDNVNKDRMAIERRVQKVFKDLHSIQTEYYKIEQKKASENMQADEAIEKNVAEQGEETTQMDES